MRRRKHRLVKTRFGCYHVESFTSEGTPFKIGRVCRREDGSWDYYSSFPRRLHPAVKYGPVKTRKKAIQDIVKRHQEYLAS